MAALSPVDLNALERLCKIVERHVQSYQEVGAALAEIRDRQLFRATHRTFDEFCRQRWEFSPQHAGRLIAASALARKIQPVGSPPKTESLARPIAALPEDEQLAAWQDAQQLAADDPVRPEHVAEAVRRRRPAKPPKRQKPIRLRVPGGTVVIEPSRGFDSAETCLQYALAQLTAKRAA